MRLLRTDAEPAAGPAPAASASASASAAPGGGPTLLLQLCLVAAPPASSPLRVLVGTWNVGNAPPPPPASLAAGWLRNPGDGADLVAVCAQECAYPPRAPHGGGGGCDADWVAAAAAALGPRYGLARHAVLGQMRLSVFARWDCLAGVVCARAAAKATGLGHVHSNKGGVAAVVHVWDTSARSGNELGGGLGSGGWRGRSEGAWCHPAWQGGTKPPCLFLVLPSFSGR